MRPSPRKRLGHHVPFSIGHFSLYRKGEGHGSISSFIAMPHSLRGLISSIVFALSYIDIVMPSSQIVLLQTLCPSDHEWLP